MEQITLTPRQEEAFKQLEIALYLPCPNEAARAEWIAILKRMKWNPRFAKQTIYDKYEITTDIVTESADSRGAKRMSKAEMLLQCYL